MLRVDISKQLGDVPIEAVFASSGRVTGLFGTSGAGKTSVINMIAGLLRPDRGTIAINGDTLDDVGTGIHVPPHRRRIGYVFQDARLFPHLNVRANLDYGRRMNALPHDAANEARIIQLLGIEPLLDRRPGALSGGERQRIAFGRALLSQPKLLLLDEPLGSLDGERKAEILPYLFRLRDEVGVPMVYVSHDVGELRQLASHVIILKQGRIVASGNTDILRDLSVEQ
jgi:molybdate transport system ATP-binding protein